MADKLKNGVHDYTGAEEYISPESPAVREHLEWFRGLKLGFMMHWGPVSQLGTMESWPLSDGDSSWSQKEIDWTDDMEEFKQQYWALNKTFNPVKFRPDKWAALAKECGFQYLLFTTKHHDGFCMYDTHETDYKITAPDCPFSANPRADIVRSLFDAFRAEGLGVSAYFSKPDWHCDHYWHSAFGTAPTRNVNYNVQEHPELWEEFVQYTHRQLTELTSHYGKIDVLWLDGGWVRPSVDGQDIRLGEIAERIRSSTQPHLIVCDRTVGGPYENIVTPEQNVPSEPMDIPWETCMSLGRYFSFHYDDTFKPARQVVHTFLDIVSKGGNLALNLTPRPDGALPEAAVHILRQFGSWLKVNGDGIYQTTLSESKPERGLVYTHKENREYAFWLFDDVAVLPPRITLDIAGHVSEVRLLRTGENVPFLQEGRTVRLNTAHVGRMNMVYADCFEVSCQ